MSYSKQNVDVNGSAMEILVFEPEGEGPVPGIVVAQHLPIAHQGLERTRSPSTSASAWPLPAMPA